MEPTLIDLEMFRGVAGKHAEELSAEMSRQTRRGMERKAAGGGINGRAPLGYRNRRRGYEAWVETDAETAPLVREAFGLLESGLPLRKALAQMTAKGLRTAAGKPLSVASFHQMVTNPAYAGLLRYGGQTYPGKHEPLISHERFWRIQGRLEQRRKRRARAADPST